MDDHLEKYEWPRPCPDPICAREASLRNDTAPQFKDQEDLRYHLIDDHGFSRTRPGPASATHGSSTLGRKRTSLNGDETLEWIAPQYFESPSMSEDGLSPSRPRKRAREIPPTICPPLLSIFATEGDECPIQISSLETVPPPVHILNDVGLHDAELTPEPEQPGRQWASTCDSCGLDGETTDPDPGSDILFSLYLRSPSPSSSTELPSECSGETLMPLDDDDSSPHPSEKPTPGSGSDGEMDGIEERRHASPSKPRIPGALDRNIVGVDGQSHAAAKPTGIRLRLNPPSRRPQGTKLILRLKGPKLGKATRKGRKKA